MRIIRVAPVCILEGKAVDSIPLKIAPELASCLYLCRSTLADIHIRAFRSKQPATRRIVYVVGVVKLCTRLCSLAIVN
jgi:hypothetical protein